MTDRKVRHTLSAAAWVATLFWCLALLSSAFAAAAPTEHASKAPTVTQAPRS